MPLEKPLILAIDIGTSSVRGAVYDGNARYVRGTAVKHERSFGVTDDGGAELDAESGFAEVVSVIDEVLERSAAVKGSIDYVATSCFWHSLVAVDERDQPITGILGWADRRSREATGVLRKRFNETRLHNRTGARFHSSYWPAKILWLGQEYPAEFARARGLVSFSDLLALRLFGKRVTSISMASGTGLFDIRKCEWDRELLGFLKIDQAMLPEIAAGSAAFTLNRTFAKRWPRLKDARWFPAIADGAADSIGAGCMGETQASLMVATSGAMRVIYTGEPPQVIPDGLWCYRVDRNRPIIGGALSDGGGLYAWLAKNLKLPKDAGQRISTRPPGSHSLTFLPFLAGERGTGYHEHARGAVLGLTSSTDPVDLLHAALEAVAFRFREIFSQLERVRSVERIVASGGAIRESVAWGQILADALGRDLELNDARESSSRGAVLLVLESIGKISDIQNYQAGTRRRVTANRERSDLYRQEFERHSKAYNLLIENPKNL